jgi:hypothetical protein
MRLGLGVAIALVLGPTFGGLVSKAQTPRQEEVAARGAEVMPFKLSSTAHIFTKTSTGGVQQVIAKNPSDTDQIRLIRSHLENIAARFHHGDYSGPTETHGAQMPGLAKLKAARPGDIRILYTNLNDGGQIEYSSKSPDLISAIHEWFDAQLSDHGADAMAGHEHMHD